MSAKATSNTKTPKADKTQSGASKKAASTRKRRHYLPAAERKQQILQAARRVFARNGLQGARTRELAQEAGINQATLFEHFNSKEELFTAAVMEPLTTLLEDQRNRAQAYTKAENREDLMNLLHIGMQQHLESTVDIFPLLVQALFSEQELGKSLYQEHLKPLMQLRTDLMKHFIRDEFDPSIVQLASFGMFFALAMDQHLGGKKHNTEDAAKQLADLMLYGCSTQQRPTS